MLIPQVQKFALIFFSRPEIYSEEGGGKSFESCCPCSQSVRTPPSHRGARRCRHTLIKRKKSHHPLSFSKKKKKSLKPFRPRGEDVSSNFARRKKEREGSRLLLIGFRLDKMMVWRERREMGDRSLYSSYLELSPPIIPIFRLGCHIAFPISIRFIIKITVDCSHYFLFALGVRSLRYLCFFKGL